MKARLFMVTLLLAVAARVAAQEEGPRPDTARTGAAVTVGVERHTSGDAALTTVTLRARKAVGDRGMGVELGVAVAPELLRYGVLPLGLDLNLFPAVRPDRPFLAFTGGPSLVIAPPVPIVAVGLNGGLVTAAPAGDQAAFRFDLRIRLYSELVPVWSAGLGIMFF